MRNKYSFSREAKRNVWCDLWHSLDNNTQAWQEIQDGCIDVNAWIDVWIS